MKFDKIENLGCIWTIFSPTQNFGRRGTWKPVQLNEVLKFGSAIKYGLKASCSVQKTRNRLSWDIRELKKCSAR